MKERMEAGMNAAQTNTIQGLLQRMNVLTNGGAQPPAAPATSLPVVPALPIAPAIPAPVMPADQIQRASYGFPMPAWGYFVGGQTGPEVASLQTHLAALGYLAGAPDGIYAYGTIEAVRYFQLEYGMPATGAFDQAAYATMMAVFAGQLPRTRGVATTPVQTPPAQGTPAQTVPAAPAQPAPTQPAPTQPAAPAQPPQSNPLGMDWVSAPQPQGSNPSSPLDVEWQTSKPPAAPQPAPEPKPEPKPEAPKTEAPKPTAPTYATYTIQSGDTLSKIAQATLGDGGRWREIYELNQNTIGSNPNVIIPGTLLKLPDGAKAPSGAAPATPAPSVDFNFPLNADQIASALGAPVANVRKYWPEIANSLKKRGITSTNAVIAVLATIQVEVGSFKPIPEYASGAAYEGRSDLGNTQPGDGVRYKGRGFIQLTGRANYTSYGKKLGVDLVGNPDLALEPRVSAEVLAEYFAQRGIPAMANRGDWQAVRKAVNGGLNGWNAFIGAVNRLKAAI
jgi:peptidoglycan hydrolase-like protein with peptidoglycan-binding domain